MTVETEGLAVLRQGVGGTLAPTKGVGQRAAAAAATRELQQLWGHANPMDAAEFGEWKSDVSTKVICVESQWKGRQVIVEGA